MKGLCDVSHNSIQFSTILVCTMMRQQSQSVFYSSIFVCPRKKTAHFIGSSSVVSGHKGVVGVTVVGEIRY